MSAAYSSCWWCHLYSDCWVLCSSVCVIKFPFKSLLSPSVDTKGCKQHKNWDKYANLTESVCAHEHSSALSGNEWIMVDMVKEGWTTQWKGVDSGAAAIGRSFVWGETKRALPLVKMALQLLIGAGFRPNRSQEGEVRPSCWWCAQGPARSDVCWVMPVESINVCHLSVLRTVAASFIAAPGMLLPGVHGCIIRPLPTAWLCYDGLCKNVYSCSKNEKISLDSY